MTVPRRDDAADAAAITIVRAFDAPRELVFANWIDPERLAAWFAPDGFTVTTSELDARPGGRWHVAYRSPAGEVYVESGEIRAIDRPSKLVLTLTQVDPSGTSGPSTLVTVTFEERGSETEMRFRQTGFEPGPRRDGNAEGWTTCFRKLDVQLEAEREIRDLFEDWARASSARDLDASMAPIAKDVVSYEHVVPLAYVGVDAVREVCRQGFEAATGDFRWDVPDLHVVVRGDVAVTWGMNRMRSEEPGKPASELWSRGTRVFQKIDGAWRMIHQHVSFPFDPATGRVVIDRPPGASPRT